MTSRRSRFNNNNGNNNGNNHTTTRGYDDDVDDDDNVILKPSSSTSTFRGSSSVANKCAPTFIARHVNPRGRLFFIVSVLLTSSHLLLGYVVYMWTITHNTCPNNMVQFLNWFGSSNLYKGVIPTPSQLIPARRTKEDYTNLERIYPQSIPKTMTPVPAEYRKTFYYDGNKISQPIARAYRSRGWRQVDDTDTAQWIYTYKSNAPWGADLQKWQRFNWLPNYLKWNSKYGFALYYKKFELGTGRVSQYVPETYLLSDTHAQQDIETFRNVLKTPQGSNHPWVLKAGKVNQVRPLLCFWVGTMLFVSGGRRLMVVI
jgi:hypothetical protein